ncbi:CMP-N-acetylneuraminate-beta-1,4-galactoside alpha-2,3-sialyltransferase-like [Glandiceps talaboti]
MSFFDQNDQNLMKICPHTRRIGVEVNGRPNEANNSVQQNFSLPDARFTVNISTQEGNEVKKLTVAASVLAAAPAAPGVAVVEGAPAAQVIPVVALPVSNYSCIPHHSVNKMKAVFNKFDEKHPVFISSDYLSLDSRLMQYQPPFGLKNQEKVLDRLLRVMTDSSLTRGNTNVNGCRRCIIVGSGGILKNTRLGGQIDGYDVIIRANLAPVRGYEADVGSKTSIRFAYPEAAPRTDSSYDPGALFGMVVFKARDLEWLEEVIEKKVPSQKGFWTKIAKSLPKTPQQVRLINPMLIQEAAFDLLGYPTNQGRMSKNVPTTGTIAIMAALRLCDEVHVAGFGYYQNQPHAYLHYYEGTRMSSITKLFTHDLNHENVFLRKLVENGVIKDLTGGIH